MAVRSMYLAMVLLYRASDIFCLTISDLFTTSPMIRASVVSNGQYKCMLSSFTVEQMPKCRWPWYTRAFGPPEYFTGILGSHNSAACYD
jgi:hypothetical protein